VTRQTGQGHTSQRYALLVEAMLHFVQVGVDWRSGTEYMRTSRAPELVGLDRLGYLTWLRLCEVQSGTEFQEPG
jgi:hypothetical protein